MKLDFIVNGGPVSLETDPLRRLLDVLREDLGLTGAKEGCGEGECGACSVLLDGRLANSCLVPACAVEGLEVTTIEGLRDTEAYRLLERSFIAAGAVQCGFCTPGLILAAYALLRRRPSPGEEAVREALCGNLCRCTGYGMIVEAVLLASRQGAGVW